MPFETLRNKKTQLQNNNNKKVEVVDLVMAVFNSQCTLIKGTPQRINVVKLTALFKHTLSVLFQEQQKYVFLKNMYLLHMHKEHMHCSKDTNNLGKAQVGHCPWWGEGLSL